MQEVNTDSPAGAPCLLTGRRLQLWTAVLMWVVPLVVICAIVAWNPSHRTVTLNYHKASADWFAGKDLYIAGEGGFHYLPQFALIFFPFHALPLPFGDIIWRLLAAVLLITGIWRMLRQQFGTENVCAFLFASILAMPLSLAPLQNGQANVIFSALTLHAVVCMSMRQWWRSAALIILAIGTKPLGIVLLLLSLAVYGPVRWRIIPFLALLFLLPFITAPTGYVMNQIRGFAGNMQVCSAITMEHRFADIGGICRTFGFELPTGISNLTRLAVGGITLMLWLSLARRYGEPLRAMCLLALTTGYLMLFNPNNEANSYVIIAPAFAIWAAAAFNYESSRNFGWWTTAICLSMGLLPSLLHPVLGTSFALFWHPLMTALFMGMLIYKVTKSDSPFSAMSYL